MNDFATTRLRPLAPGILLALLAILGLAGTAVRFMKHAFRSEV